MIYKETFWMACDSTEQRKPVVLCAAEIASLAQSGDRGTDPRIGRATSLARAWAESGADSLKLLAAECDALDAASEYRRAADYAARLAHALQHAGMGTPKVLENDGDDSGE